MCSTNARVIYAFGQQQLALKTLTDRWIFGVGAEQNLDADISPGIVMRKKYLARSSFAELLS